MKKLTRKQIVTIVVSAVIVVALIITGIVLGTRSNNNENKIDTDKKVESVEKEDKKETEDSKTEETEKADAVVSETTENTMEQETDTQTPVVEEPKQETTQQQNSSNTTNNQNSSNFGGATTTPSVPNASHTHTWTEVWGPVSVPETGEYKTIDGVKTWVVKTPAGTENRVVAYKCSCGETKNVPNAGMYAKQMDRAALERLDKCYNILCSGIASQYVPATHEYNSVGYWDDTIVLCADGTSGAWMYVLLAGWYADTTNVGSDETRPGYAEIPSLVKQCLETIAPEGGTELYNKVSALVSQYGADYHVPTQGKISESIPGLYVTLEDGKNGLEIRFWAE